MKFKTSLSIIADDGSETIRGKELETLVRKQSFVQTIFFLFTGTFPTKQQEVMLNALFVSSIDHGPGPVSTVNARLSASSGNSIHTSLAAGVLGFGPRHGIAGEGAMKFFYEHIEHPEIGTLLKELKAQKIRIPGYGHTVFTDVDPRTEFLLSIAKEQGIFGKYSEFALRVKGELDAITSKPLPLNIDGAYAAILCDMNLDPRLGQIFFLISRTPGLLAEIYEEQDQDVGIRHLKNDEIEFAG